MREDMNKYNTTYISVPSQRTEGETAKAAGATAKTMGGMLWKLIKTVLVIGVIVGGLVLFAAASIILSFRNTEPPDISAMKLNYSSFVYTMDEATGQEKEYMTIHSSENRVWVELSEIPDYMKTAQIAIEDHRFMEHHGVDWTGTLGAVYRLVGGGEGRGGSTLTQQLIKNITEQNQVSILRKVREIFTALNLEGGYTDNDGVYHHGYSKDEILQAYLNVVNYGGTCQGVQAAANYYFDKDISQCTLAECALIAGITQNPYQYNPTIFPEDSIERAEVVLDRMWELSQEGELVSSLTRPITRQEYTDAKAELAAMTAETFIGADLEEEDMDANQDEALWDDYMDTMFEDIIEDLMAKYGYSYERAEATMYNAGYHIVSAVDPAFQKDITNIFHNGTVRLPADQAVELAYYMMDPYTGKVMAIVGRRGERHGIRISNYATGIGVLGRQSGSSIKPLSAYSVGFNEDLITYGSVLKDEPIPHYFGEDDDSEGPQNFSLQYEGVMNVDRAIEQSQNAPAAWLCKQVTPEACYDWLTNSLQFTSLTEDDSHSISAMALGGQSYGVYLDEMVAGYQIFANGGIYHKPITYWYVKDHDGNVILDNRPEANPGEQVMSRENATIMNKLLQRPIHGAWGTATSWFDTYPVEMYGKTGTSEDMYDLWFIAATPFCVAGIWNGYTYNEELTDTGIHKDTWKDVMDYVLEHYSFPDKQWVLSESVSQHVFCRDSGKLAGPNCFSTDVGWFDDDKLPGTCNGGTDHVTGKNKATTAPSILPSAAPTAAPSMAPSMAPSEAPSAVPSAAPSQAPSAAPTGVPIDDPTPTPTGVPIDEPTQEPTDEPTDPPTFEPDVPTPPPEESSSSEPDDETIIF